MVTIDDLIQKIKFYAPNADLDLVRLAFEYAKKAHGDQKRLSGEPYINHPLATAMNLAEMKMNQDIIIAGLLHDIPEETNSENPEAALRDIKHNFGEEVAFMVRGITKLGKIKYRGIERYLENLRKMFVAMAQDVRVIFIKFADRLHNLETLEAQPSSKQKRIAMETMEIYAPIANRLGMGEIKGRLEDLSFKYLYPKDFEQLKKAVTPRYRAKEEYLKKIRVKLLKTLATFSLGAPGEGAPQRIKVYSIHGRTKRLWSIYKKLETKGHEDLSKIYDIVALRVIVETVAECYTVLGIIHQLWKPLKGRIKDYIAQPKPNGYQSLHTTVFCDDGEIVEFQIRTKKMHEEAEYGIAAHWYYDEKSAAQVNGKELKWVRELTKWKKEFDENQRYLESLKIDVFQNRIFVFTPKGDVIDLPEEATPVDFAYTLHTDLGDKCTGAKVNDQIARLDAKLQSGDVVEVTIDKNKKNPSADWLKSVKTSVARHKIKSRLKKAKRG